VPAPAWDPDGFPWPLPLQIIKGGRYRVEALLQATADSTTGENVYRVRDLQGYERCWSCGAEYGAEHATDTFCRQCGADLFGRLYRMYEHRLPPGEAVGDTAAQVVAEPAETASDDAGVASESLAAPLKEHRFIEGHRAYRVIPDVPEPSPFPNGPRLLVGAAADVGKTRPGEQNEDSLGVFLLSLGVDSRMYPVALAIVADGLGGHVSGQEASRLVVRTLADYVLRQLAPPFFAGSVTGEEAEEHVMGLLREAASAANVALCDANAAADADSGSTLVAMLVLGGTAYLANVGDSRAYALAAGELRRLTTDHSLVEQLIAAGIITPEERYIHPHRNQILKSLGDDPALQPDTFVQRLQPGMRLLLCSDGVWEMVRDDELARLLADAPDPQQAAEALVARANENGGEDNISAVVLEVRA
jgi:serine/threonine protein phosphatase PrpC